MAWCPFATRKPLPENSTQSGIEPSVAILHSAVDGPGPSSLYPYFSRLDVVTETHFFVKLTGEIEQYMDTNVRADGNRSANGFAVSIETEDEGNPDGRPWNDAQLAAIKRLLEWLLATHPKIERRVCPAWNKAGVGYHSMWGSPSEWTPAVGKTCPGTVRIEQFWTVIKPWLEHGDPRPPEDEEEVEMVIIRCPGKPDGLLSGDAFIKLRDAVSVKGFTDKGIKVVVVTDGDYERINKEAPV